ncbi:aldose epimerase family protein [Actinacidiphila bryophytorum]|uniref:Aldose 1-epimerase n=1 Tax=Actinacidiphila bryophytorum TaxID=1436133 RepID=A0A9W4GYP4_9ACTN|nr:aldose epimerase family protein [Actinacidiphila bryophytorum]MBM9438066.1 galactose mutarotase [Actinacidiphila bryophytorum]MBN6543369.1 galactose mutarotase [Actinacidiphila bryophytorum]CAG7618472.1 Aldose 1-epimerase [Actinacidiphila bryophytorum]
MPTVTRSTAGRLPDGREVEHWQLAAGPVTVGLLDLGASLHSARCPDRSGRVAETVVSPLDIGDRFGAARYFGATVGRYANRIGGALLPLDGDLLPLSANESGNTLHGGVDGFDLRSWSARPAADGTRAGVEFSLVSPAGDQGFPGRLEARVTYSLGDEGDLVIDYTATSDAPTVVNLTNHAYWNLAGGADETVSDHELQVLADHYTRVDPGLLPLPGPHESVAGTPFDLREPRALGKALTAGDEQIRMAGGGYDHNWVLRAHTPGMVAPAAVLSHPGSGRRLECLTTEPGIQVYTGNHFDGSFPGSDGRPVPRFAGVALETQHFPDGPNRPDFPSVRLAPGDVYRSTTVYRFGLMP